MTKTFIILIAMSIMVGCSGGVLNGNMCNVESTCGDKLLLNCDGYAIDGGKIYLYLSAHNCGSDELTVSDKALVTWSYKSRDGSFSSIGGGEPTFYELKEVTLAPGQGNLGMLGRADLASKVSSSIEYIAISKWSGGGATLDGKMNVSVSFICFKYQELLGVIDRYDIISTAMDIDMRTIRKVESRKNKGGEEYYNRESILKMNAP